MASGSASDLVTVLVNSSTLAAFAVAAALVGISVIAHRVWPEHLSPWRIAAGAAFLGILAVTQLPTRPLSELAN